MRTRRLLSNASPTQKYLIPLARLVGNRRSGAREGALALLVPDDSLKSFLWRYGTNGDDAWHSYQSLLRIYFAIASSDGGAFNRQLADFIVRTFPETSEAGHLKRDLYLKGKLSATRFDWSRSRSFEVYSRRAY